MKKILSFVLSLALCLGVCAPALAAQPQDAAKVENDAINVMAENSFGNLLASEIDAELDAQEKNRGYNIFSVEVTAGTAYVQLETLEDATVVVGIYKEAGDALLASGYADVTHEDKAVFVDIETEEMPEYFFVKAFLVDPVDMNPLCTVYTTPNYTQEMQEFFSKTVEDFEADRVLSLDGDPGNNFAVYGADVKIIPESDTANRVVSVDETTKTYVIENADQNITSLQAGETFSCAYGEGEVLIVKVADIAVSGTTATITGGETDMESVFDYVKIDTAAGVGENGYDPSTVGNGIAFAGFETPVSRATNIGGSADMSVKLNIGEESGNAGILVGKVSGSVTMNVKGSFSLYITENYRSLTLLVNYGFKVNVSISVKAELLKLKMGTVTISPVAGLYIRMTPSILVEASAKMSFKGELTGSIGFTTNTDTGMKDLTSNPELDGEIEGEFKIFVGVSMEPEVVLVSEWLAEAEMEATVGAEMTGKFTVTGDIDNDVKHECARCLDGDIEAKVSVEFSAKFLSNENWSFELTLLDLSWKLGDFYWSVDKGEFGFTACPYYTMLVTTTVYDRFGQPAVGAEVVFGYPGKQYTRHTDGEGKVEVFLPGGKYTAKATQGIYYSAPLKVVVEDKTRTIKLNLTEDKFDPANAYRVKSVDIGYNLAGAVMENGDLYMWGENMYGEAGVGLDDGELVETPTKVLEDVVKVSCGHDHAAAITENGDLYTWGYNGGELGFEGGNGTALYRELESPTKVRTDVKDVDCGNGFTAVVMENGDMYIWGGSYYADLSYEMNETGLVMQNVVQVACASDTVAALTEDGDLYLWGYNNCGQVGNGTTGKVVEPYKALGNVIAMDTGGLGTAAITADGSLYSWGRQSDMKKEVPQGADDYITSPQRLMGGVAQVSVGGVHLVILTNAGNVLTMGYEYSGQLGVDALEESDGSLKMKFNSMPVQVTSGGTHVSGGGQNTGVVSEEGELFICGTDNFGLLGNDDGIYGPVRTLTRVWFGGVAEASAPLMLSMSGPMPYDGKQRVTYDALEPGKTYNFYVMKDRTVDAPFGADNLLYIDQGVASEYGMLTFTYTPTEVCPYGDVILVEADPEPVMEYTSGDVDMNGTVNVADIMKLKALIMADQWSDEELAIGDLDESGRLDVGDIMAVKNIIMSA